MRVAHDNMGVARDLACVVGRDAAGSELVNRSLGDEQYFTKRLACCTGCSPARARPYGLPANPVSGVERHPVELAGDTEVFSPEAAAVEGIYLAAEEATIWARSVADRPVLKRSPRSTCLPAMVSSSPRDVGVDEGRVSAAAHKRVRLAVLLACLGALVFYTLATRTDVVGLGTGTGGSSTGGAWALGCPARGAPSVARVAPGYLAELRSGVRRVMRGRHGRLYQLGTLVSEDAWSDNSPRPGAVLLPNVALVPGAYEMRWWAPDRDDVAADVFVFTGASQANDFFERASSVRCRRAGVQMPVSSLPHARDLMWLNPDDVFQEDVYLLRGQRVYRVGDVRQRQGGRAGPSAAERRVAFSIVNGLACALPGSGCRAPARSPFGRRP